MLDGLICCARVDATTRECGRAETSIILERCDGISRFRAVFNGRVGIGRSQYRGGGLTPSPDLAAAVRNGGQHLRAPFTRPAKSENTHAIS